VRREDALSTVHPLVIPEIVTLPEKADVSNASRMRQELTSALGEQTTVLIADMLLTEFCDSSGIRHLLIADEAARLRGVELRVVVQSCAVLKVNASQVHVHVWLRLASPESLGDDLPCGLMASRLAGVRGHPAQFCGTSGFQVSIACPPPGAISTDTLASLG
jgi:anti-anti-sigma regulatory factor